MKRALRILLVEDSPVTAKMLAAMIQSDARIEVETAGTLKAAQERLEVGGIDAVVLDLTLPDADCLEAFEGVKGHALPIVVVTGIDKDGFEQRVMEGGAEDYLLKPGLDADELVRAIRHAMIRHRRS